ncbi:adenine DNA glycosylase isoform X2 [Diospyros lotus]|uniref:adenine DNA glycosylase isoform X2 n=1 Tax=Diospyros lotus TaxID=55363 RepID=UPI002252B337|nr:adenine DNA glycosylase isoform X2 [Diospyros lotus]XP_052198361.1 adenine DNA glycosylase isoform X2 [Diospyros lotus]
MSPAANANSYIQTNQTAGKIWHLFPSSLLLTHRSPPTVASMEDAVAAKKKKRNTAAATTSTATTEKRPRRVRHRKPESDVGDIEDFDFGRDETLEIRVSLLDWYDRNKRDLPWRRISSVDENDDEDEAGSESRAYAVWVSEVMLQQTRVQTVIDYFNRWVQRWPTVGHLACASIEVLFVSFVLWLITWSNCDNKQKVLPQWLQEVNEMWAGLGYYRRARYLLEGAKLIVQGGKFPETVSDLLKVPGIGDYTAGAIASIAFKEVTPIVDGNVVRVLARLKAISENPKDSVTIKNLWKLAGQLVDPSRPGDFNQALMELGATLCTPLSPSCSVCPVAAHCQALSLSRQYTSSLVTDYPIKVVKSKQRHDFSAVSVVEILEGEYTIGEHQSDGKFLLVKRPDEGLLAGLWEFPSVLLGGEADLVTRRDSVDQFLKESFNLDLRKSCTAVFREDIGEYIHIFSHIRLKMYVELLVLHLKGGMHVLHGKTDSKIKAWKLVDTKTLSSMGLTSGVRKVTV